MANNKGKQNKFNNFSLSLYVIGLVLFTVALISGLNFFTTKKANTLIEECNEGRNEKCDELLEHLSDYIDSSSEEARITNPYFTEKLQKINKVKVDEKRKKQEEQQRKDGLLKRIVLCKMLLQENLKDPSSFKELNGITEQMSTGIIRYSATNSFGARIQDTYNCNK